jgi:hypothetical protein
MDTNPYRSPENVGQSPDQQASASSQLRIGIGAGRVFGESVRDKEVSHAEEVYRATHG